MVVRGRSARKLETVVFLTNMDAIRDQAAQAMLREGWMAKWQKRTLTGSSRTASGKKGSTWSPTKARGQGHGFRGGLREG